MNDSAALDLAYLFLRISPCSASLALSCLVHHPLLIPPYVQFSRIRGPTVFIVNHAQGFLDAQARRPQYRASPLRTTCCLDISSIQTRGLSFYGLSIFGTGC